MLYIAISFTLLVILATLYFIAKVKKEGFDRKFTLAGYGVLIVAALLLLCQVGHGLIKMRHHFHEPHRMGQRDFYMHRGMRRGMWWHEMNSRDGRMDGWGCGMKKDGNRMESAKDGTSAK